jgi:6-phosphogluconolactonase
MASIAVQYDAGTVASVAAEITAGILNQAIASQRKANWLLAGGRTPMEAYELLARNYKDKIDWNKVVVALSDERCVPANSTDATWPQINQALLSKVFLPQTHQLRPHSDQAAEAAAIEYERLLSGSATDIDSEGIPYFDLVWLGMGEDGHTMSLFPGHTIETVSEPLVIPVHDSPKPPPDRISLTPRALTNTANALVIVTGIEKAKMITRVLSEGADYPINRAVAAIEHGGGKVTWLIDEVAYSFTK